MTDPFMIAARVRSELGRLCEESRDKPTPLSLLIHHRIAEFLPSEKGREALGAAAQAAAGENSGLSAKAVVRATLREMADGDDEGLLSCLAGALLASPHGQNALRTVLRHALQDAVSRLLGG